MYKLTNKQITAFLNGELRLSVHERYKEDMVMFCRNNCTDKEWYTSYSGEYIHFYTKAVYTCLMTKNHVKTIKKINKQQYIDKLIKDKERIESEIERLK